MGEGSAAEIAIRLYAYIQYIHYFAWCTVSEKRSIPNGILEPITVPDQGTQTIRIYRTSAEQRGRLDWGERVEPLHRPTGGHAGQGHAGLKLRVMSIVGSDATGEGEGTCQDLPEGFLEELQEGFEFLPEDVGSKLLEAIDKVVLEDRLMDRSERGVHRCAYKFIERLLCGRRRETR